MFTLVLFSIIDPNLLHVLINMANCECLLCRTQYSIRRVHEQKTSFKLWCVSTRIHSIVTFYAREYIASLIDNVLLNVYELVPLLRSSSTHCFSALLCPVFWNKAPLAAVLADCLFLRDRCFFPEPLSSQLTIVLEPFFLLHNHIHALNIHSTFVSHNDQPILIAPVWPHKRCKSLSKNIYSFSGKCVSNKRSIFLHHFLK